MTTQNVITMEYVPGIKINDIAKIDAAGIDRNLLAKYSAESYLTQLCRHGFFREYTSYSKAIYFLSSDNRVSGRLRSTSWQCRV
jgi:hypothetical protein